MEMSVDSDRDAALQPSVDGEEPDTAWAHDACQCVVNLFQREEILVLFIGSK